VARIIGEKEFWGMPFRLSPGTLVPRPDTETLVEAAIEAIRAAGLGDERLRLLDLGTGTGCILLAALSELPNATGIGVDRSADAVATATINAEQLGLSDRAVFRVGDWAEGIDGPFDAILSNPPYVEDGGLPELPVEVVGYDPRLALAGGEEGTDAHKAIIAELPRLLKEKGFAVLEFGHRQAALVAEIAAAAGFHMEVLKDLGGRDRAGFLTITREVQAGATKNRLENQSEAATFQPPTEKAIVA
jgi:release factor glutamine methyltransferase